MKWKGKVDFESMPKYDGDDLITNNDVVTISGVLSAEIDSDISIHAGLPNAHHSRSHAITGISDHTANNWKVFYSDGSGNIQELAFGTDGQVLTSTGASTAPAFEDAAAGSGDVTASGILIDNAIIRGDGGGKGVHDSKWSITDAGLLSSSFSKTGYIIDVHNTLTSGGYGFRIKAGEVLGDIAFHVADTDDTFQIMELEADQGHATFGDTYAGTLSARGVVYGIDIQHDGAAKDFNTQFGTYRIAGVDVVMPTGGTTGQVLEKVDGTNYNTQWADPSGGGGTFGSEFQQVSSEGESSTTAGSYQQKLRMTTSDLPSGTYRISWSYETDGQGDPAETRVHLDDSTEIGYNRYDSSLDGYIQVSGFKYESSFSGVHTIDIDYRDLSSAACLIRRARLELWRVS